MFSLAARPPGGEPEPTRHEPAQEIGLEDWSTMLGAVKDRLWQIGRRDPLAGVLECAAALTQLHSTLPHELGWRRASRCGEVDAPPAVPAERPVVLGSAVFCLDLEGLEPVNAVYGRGTGDALLRIVAARLALRVRADDVVERLGGDRFCILLADVPDRTRLGDLACRVFDAVAAPVKIGRLELRVRPSIGIAVSPVDGTAADALLTCAEAAMRRARQARIGHAFFQDEWPASADPIHLQARLVP